MSYYVLDGPPPFEGETLSDTIEKRKRELNYRDAYLLLAHGVRKVVCLWEIDGQIGKSLNPAKELDNILAASELCLLEGRSSSAP